MAEMRMSYPSLFEMNEPTAGTQNAHILMHLQSGRTITSLQALHLCGSLRLAARISDLRRSGYRIAMTRIKTDGGKSVAEYRLVA